MLPRLEVVRRLRPIDLVVPDSAVTVSGASGGARASLRLSASYAAVVMPLRETTGTLALHVGGHRLAGHMDGAAAWLTTGPDGSSGTVHRSRRHGTAARPPGEVALTLTGEQLTLLTRDDGPRTTWTARARVDLGDRRRPLPVDLRDPGVLAAVEVETSAPATAGRFGQLGLRDIRVVTRRDGTPLHEGSELLLTATSAGPGFFDTAHTSVWGLDPASLDLRHRGDLFFGRPDRPGIFGDHATHVVHDDGRWLVATSTWGDFRADDPDRGVRVTIAVTDADITRGEHVLDTDELPLPTDGFRSVGVWDPHLVHTGEEWLVGFASARKFFRFHPALAAGPSLDRLALRGAATDRRATEGTTVLCLDGEWRVLASDGRDGRRGERARYPVFDLGLAEVGELAAAYPTNLPWPTLVETPAGWLMITFNGRPTGGPLLGYGTHGEVVVQREVDAAYP